LTLLIKYRRKNFRI